MKDLKYNLKNDTPEIYCISMKRFVFIYYYFDEEICFECEPEEGGSHPRTQGLFGKDPGIVWSRDSTKINCPRGSGKVSNYMLENVTVNFKYQEWDFTIHRSKRSLTSILYFCLLLNYKSTVAFYQQSSQETNKSYTLKFEVGYSLTNIFSYQTGQSSTFVYFRFYLFLKYAIYRFVVCKR